MQFSIWHWVIVLLLIGVPVFFALRSARKPSQNSADLVGFGGWLMLLAIGQTLSPLRTLATLGSSRDGYNQLMLVPNGPMVVYGEVALLLAFLVLQLVVLVAMLRRSLRFKQLFLIQWLAIPVVFILDAIWISTGLGVPVGQVVTGHALAAPIVSFVLTGLWVAYVYKSVRVRNTFTGVRASSRVVPAS
ncbi:DUF2569 family protein [Mesorhizobium newzealandense]|uniref:DUF2569 family protein n=1 Tax=Mesorhizobium newzealandense TaxID=1300302 RepID=A0ABW4U884_9HYPH